MQSIFFNITGISGTISIVIILLLLLSAFLSERYTVKWRYIIWLFLALRLILPVDFGLTPPPLEINLTDHKIIYPMSQDKLSELSIPEPDDLASEGVSGWKQEQEENENRLAPYNAQQSAASKEEKKAITVSQIASGIYFLGIVLFLLWQFGLYFTFRQTTKRWCKAVTNQQIIETYEDLKSRMGIGKPIKIMICKKIPSPMIVSLFKPTLLLPHEGYQKIDLEVILKHELIHFKRNDLWYKLILICVNAVHWFNPIIYRMVKEANKDIEISCDEEVLKDATPQLRKRYSERILELMQRNNDQEVPISTNFHGGKDMLKSRIQHIFDERGKKKGILSICLIMTLVLLFSAFRFNINQNWQIPITEAAGDAYGQNEMGERNSKMSDVIIKLPFDEDLDGTKETSFSLLVSEEGSICKLKYEKTEERRSVETEVLKGIEPGIDYRIQAANMQDLNSIMLLISVDYRGMPFGSGYWELYSWKNGSFEQIKMKSIEENLMAKIVEPAELNYPVAGLYFKEDLKTGEEATLEGIYYVPLTEYDVEGYHTWGQDAINKTMIGMELVSGDQVAGWKEPSLALLKTEEVVYITLPNITATVKSYYQYRDGTWKKIDAIFE